MENRRIAVLLSGRGSNFIAIHEAIRRRDLDAEICVVVSNVAEAPGLAKAREFGLHAVCLPSRGADRIEYDRQLSALLKERNPALVCLAGFMRILSGPLISEYRGRILNIHPALLPSFPGLHGQRQALNYGVKITGCTVHYVDEGVDTGPIIMQRAVEVKAGDTEESLSARILEQEHDVYWRAIAHALRRYNEAEIGAGRGV